MSVPGHTLPDRHPGPGAWPPEEKACLAWFKDRIKENYLKADELQKVSNVRILAELKYGAVYEIKPIPEN